MSACPACGAPHGDGAKFCSECGTTLLPPAAEAQTRKTLTALFCDVTGSTALGERRDAEVLRQVMTSYFAAMRRVLERHGGNVEKFIGDAVVALFGVPVLHEDDALRAVRAASEMHVALAELNAELDSSYGVRLEIRVGVNTGEVVVGSGDRGTVATGDAVNLAARLEQHADPGQTLVGAGTWRLVHDAAELVAVPPLTLKGKAEPVPAWRLVAVDDVTAPLDRGRRGLRSPLVGRQAELALLRQAFRRCVADRTCQLVTILGTAGVGKTRLLAELVGDLGPARVLPGRCLSYGEGTAFWPLAEMLRAAAGLPVGGTAADGRARVAELLAGEPDAAVVVERLAPLAGLGGVVGSAEETHWAVRRWVEALARHSPLVLVVDDVHWAEPAMLDVIEHLADWVRDAPVLLVCLARPEFLDARPGWAGGKLNSSTALLAPLGDPEVGTLLGNLLDGVGLDAAVGARIRSTAGGNPLFVEQLLAMLVDDGLLRRVGGRWAPLTDLPQLDLPPTITALLAARLDRLAAGERRALQAASVAGEVGYLGAVGQLLTDASPDVVRRDLLALVRKDLLRPVASDIAGEQGLRFVHVLVRESAYQSLPKGRRADLHERFARWLTGRASADDIDEFVGYHLEQAYRLRAELGPVDDTLRGLAVEAAGRLAAAAARIGSSFPGSVRMLLQRACDLLPADAAERPELLIRLGVARRMTGRLGAAVEAFEQARLAGVHAGDELLVARAELYVLGVRLTTDRELSVDSVLTRAGDGVVLFEARGDDDGLFAAYRLQAVCLNLRGDWDEMGAVLGRAEQVARRTGDLQALASTRRALLSVLMWGWTPAAEALARTEEMAADQPSVSFEFQAFVDLLRAVFYAMLDREPEARAALARGVRGLDIGTDLAVAIFGNIGGYAAMILRDLELADRLLLTSAERLQGIGETVRLATVSAMLGAVRLDRGDGESAVSWARTSRQVTSDADADAQSRWRALQARLDARAGRLDSARRLADEAVDWSDRTDQSDVPADARVARAEVLRAAGDEEGASRSLREALERYVRKQNRRGARRVEALLATAAEAVPR